MHSCWTVGLALVIALSGIAAIAQGQLVPGEPITRQLQAGETHAYEITLQAGDYVTGYVDQQAGVVFASAAYPDGSLLRPFPGPFSGKREFAFVAETGGTYRLNLRAPAVAQAAPNGVKQPDNGAYTLLVTERISAAERTGLRRMR